MISGIAGMIASRQISTAFEQQISQACFQSYWQTQRGDLMRRPNAESGFTFQVHWKKQKHSHRSHFNIAISIHQIDGQGNGQGGFNGNNKYEQTENAVANANANAKACGSLSPNKKRIDQ